MLCGIFYYKTNTILIQKRLIESRYISYILNFPPSTVPYLLTLSSTTLYKTEFFVKNNLFY